MLPSLHLLLYFSPLHLSPFSGWASRRSTPCGYGPSYWCVSCGSPWWDTIYRPTSTWPRRVWTRWRRRQEGLAPLTFRRWWIRQLSLVHISEKLHYKRKSKINNLSRLSQCLLMGGVESRVNVSAMVLLFTLSCLENLLWKLMLAFLLVTYLLIALYMLNHIVNFT